MKNILNIENLSIGYTTKKLQNCIASNINVEVLKPSFIALIGENGIGKSTLLRTISKVQKSLKGSVLIHNKNINNCHNIDLSKQISLVMTERIPPSNLTVFEVIALGRQVYTNWLGTLSADDKSVIDSAIKQVGITNLKAKKIDELSDGQYQKVMIARALAQDTTIIILDEPTAHLDIVNKAAIFNLLKQLVKDQNKTIIISSHELQLTLQFADDLWIMKKDKFESGAKQELIAHGILNNLFESENISFDKNTNQFIFH